jgi:hypothetical protein
MTKPGLVGSGLDAGVPLGVADEIAGDGDEIAGDGVLLEVECVGT